MKRFRPCLKVQLHQSTNAQLVTVVVSEIKEEVKSWVKSTSGWYACGIIRDWDAKWYAEKEYADYLHEDLAIRKFIQTELADASVSRIGN